jgi:choline dehydrogenase
MQVFFDGYYAMCSQCGKPEECENTGNLQNCTKRRLWARPTLTIPESKGYLKLNSSNPLDYPLMYPHYLESQRDVDILVDGIKLIIKLANTPALQKYGLTIDTTPAKGCESYAFRSDEYFACALRRETGPEHHQGGTTKMGPVEDTMAVVDNHLRVHGIKNIRVVDTGIFPTLPNCNPTSVIIMMAEKVSDLIKATWVKDWHSIAELLRRPAQNTSGCDPYIHKKFGFLWL